MLLALLALFTFNDVVTAPPGRWTAAPVEARERARLVCEFSLMGEGSGVRAALLTAEAASRLREGRIHSVLVSTGYAQTGTLRREVDPGRYVLLIDNRMEPTFTAEVWLRMHFEPVEAPPGEAPRELPRRTRVVVIAISAVFLVSVAAYVRLKLGRARKRRRESGGR